MPTLPSEVDSYGGRVIDAARLPSDAASFSASIVESLDSWRSEGVPLVWLALPLGRADLVPAAVAAGFVYHHASADLLQLTCAISERAHVPPFATHYVGGGGFVLAPDRRLLVVRERHHRAPHYKLPGGALQPGEHLADAVVREVEEETGIRTEYVSLVCFRHWHGYRHGKSDIYFVSRLRPLSLEIRPDPREIAECLWMPIEEYLEHPATHAFNRRVARAALDLDGAAALRPESISGYGTAATHELFLPGSAR